jgi:ACS family tartrate transporter-like MFS transporter
MTLPPESVPRDTSDDSDGAQAALQSAIRKAALRFVPLLTIAYLFNYLDRTSLGFAALTMNHELGLSAGQFGFAAGISSWPIRRAKSPAI